MRTRSIPEAAWRWIGLACPPLALAGCTVLPVAEVDAIRARDGGEFDLGSFVAGIWPARVQGELRARALPLAALRQPADELGARSGNRAGEGSPWTFALRGEGVVQTIDRDSPRGRVEVATAAGPVTIQTGPVVSGSTIRDALPFIAFDDFPDQISFAETGMALTDRALAELRPALANMQVGDRVSFLATASITGGDDAPLLLTPVELLVRGGGGTGR